MFRPSHIAVGALALLAAACNDSVNSNLVPVISTAAVRLVNDTDTPISVARTAVPDSATTLIFGAASACLTVDLSNTTAPPITVTNVATGASITFTPNLTAGDNVTIVVFGDTAVGRVLFATLSNRFVPAANDAGLRFFNGVPRAGALFMMRNGIALTPNILVGAASPFVSVPTDSASITFANG